MLTAKNSGRVALGIASLLSLGLLAVDAAPAMAKKDHDKGLKQKRGAKNNAWRNPGNGKPHPRADLDRDGVPNNKDWDIDGDRIANSRDKFPYTRNRTSTRRNRIPWDPDTDRDGTPDSRDRDRDGDGIANNRDRYPNTWNRPNTRPASWTPVPNRRRTNPTRRRVHDTDRDGTRNGRDRDIDGDGIRNRHDRDQDGDRIPNRADPRDRTPGKVRDRDGDRVADSKDKDRDGDGVPNSRDKFPYDRKRR